MTLVGENHFFALAAVLLSVVAFSFWAETVNWGQKIGGPLLILVIAMALANLRVIPHVSGLYASVGDVLVPMAIPLLLLRADLKLVFTESGPMLLAFVLAAGATIVGAFVGVYLIDMGTLEPQIAGTLAASYIGGSLNFVATAEAVGIKESAIYLAAFSADSVGAVLFLIVLMSMPAFAFVRRAMPSKFMDESGRSLGEKLLHHEDEPGSSFDLGRAANGIAISLIICALSSWITSMLGLESIFILIVTALSLAVANFGKKLVAHVGSDFEIGTLFMYIFFAAIGAGANINEVFGAAFPMLMFIGVMVVVHLVLLVVIGRFLKLDLAEVMVASNACILGPATAAALAASKGWRPLITPGMLVGLLGYAFGTFIGVAMTAIIGA
jgi:uncharacterized membrane protein